MEDALPFGSREYFLYLAMLLFARGMDLFSTRVATPNLELEANPLARKLGWKWGIPFNVVMAGLCGLYPLPAVIISTTSLLVAAHNFQNAALMRTMGELGYRHWMRERLAAIPAPLFFSCLLAQTLLTAVVGGALVWTSEPVQVAFGIGLGLLGYAAAVFIFTSISVWRSRRQAR
jgi:hypothetical protein